MNHFVRWRRNKKKNSRLEILSRISTENKSRERERGNETKREGRKKWKREQPLLPKKKKNFVKVRAARRRLYKRRREENKGEQWTFLSSLTVRKAPLLFFLLFGLVLAVGLFFFLLAYLFLSTYLPAHHPSYLFSLQLSRAAAAAIRCIFIYTASVRSDRRVGWLNVSAVFPLKRSAGRSQRKEKLFNLKTRKNDSNANGGRGWEEENVVITDGDFFLLFRDSFLLFLINRFFF